MRDHTPRRIPAALGTALALLHCFATTYAAAPPNQRQDSSGAGSGEVKPASAWTPVTGPDLVLWLDAQDIEGKGAATDKPPQSDAIGAWSDKSSYRNDARQTVPDRRPTLVGGVLDGGLRAVHFAAAKQQHLSAGNPVSLDLSLLTAFAVVRASGSGNDMWLFSKNHWGPPWTGYGIAISRDGLRPWPHLGLGNEACGYFQFGTALDSGFRVVELTYDGKIAQGRLEANPVREQAVRGSIASNDLPLTIGTLASQFLEGDLAEILIYRRPLNAREREQTRRYLVDKYSLPLTQDEPGASPLVSDWLFQAREHRLAERARQEIDWARELAARLAKDPRAPSLREDLAELEALAGTVPAVGRPALSGKTAKELYLAVRRVKRRLMFKNPAVNFTQLLFIDQPLPQGSESSHEAVHRLGTMAVSGGRLLVLDDLRPDGKVRELTAGTPGSFWRPELSFDARKVLFCFKPQAAKSFHLYEMNLDGTGRKQLTDSIYDDIDPIYLPDGHIMFTSTRGNTYVRCGPYIYSYVLARCDADGRNVYLISMNSEPDFVPSLLNDGRVVYSRWEYSDKDQNRVQSLWTTLQDGRHTSVLWGNQSVWPDHLAEPRPMPGSGRVMFTSVGHHDWFHGAIGIIDPSRGFNFPSGLTRVTFDQPWAEVGNSPAEQSESACYHASGRYTGYMAPYPLSEEDFLVSARGETDKFGIYLMDVHGNRELIYEGLHNAWYATPLRPRPVPPQQPDLVTWPGTGTDRKPVQTGVFYSADVLQGVPDLPRSLVKFLRVFQQDAKTYSTWQKIFAFSGPAVSAVQSEAVKRIVSTVPVEPDGSVYFEAPAGQTLFFQLLDEHQRALHTMRSFTGLLPGEQRGCVGCHSMHSAAAANKPGLALRHPPTALIPPPWGTETIGYARFVQPVLDRHCGKCHQGDGKARAKLDLTLRPAPEAFALFKEPYLTLLGPAAWPVAAPAKGQPGYGIAGAIPVYGLQPEDVYPNDRATDGPSTIHRELRPLRYLSAKSPLIRHAMSGEHHEVKVDPVGLLRLIAWVDANCPYLGEEEVRAMADPEFTGIDQLPIRPRLKTAPTIARP
jgi:hypothetical protein